MNSLMGNNQAMSNAKQKAESTGVFSLHPSPAPRLCVNSSSPVGVAKHRLILYWNTAVLLLPSTCSSADRPSTRLEDCRIITSFYWGYRACLHGEIGILPYYYTSFYSDWVRYSVMKIGILPYYYFLLLPWHSQEWMFDWKTAVLLLPSTRAEQVHRIPWLEDCRITTSFYSTGTRESAAWIGRLLYYYFLLLWDGSKSATRDWKTAVLLLPSTNTKGGKERAWLEYCRIITSFYSVEGIKRPKVIGRLPYL